MAGPHKPGPEQTEPRLVLRLRQQLKTLVKQWFEGLQVQLVPQALSQSAQQEPEG